MKSTILAALLVSTSLAAQAGTFVNGNFETGNATGWTIGGGSRAGTLNPALNAADFLPGGSKYNSGIATTHSGAVTAGIDANTVTGSGASATSLNRVYSGNYSWRVEDTTNGGYASVIQQTVVNYTDPNIFFAWAAVLEGAHGATDAATVKILLQDVTKGTTLISREYNAGTSGSGVDARFKSSNNGFFWTPWQIEQLAVPQGNIGDTLTLTILAADCSPAGHEGYLYLDGFGAVTPPPVDPGTGIPAPGTLALLGLGALGLGMNRRRRAD